MEKSIFTRFFINSLHVKICGGASFYVVFKPLTARWQRCTNTLAQILCIWFFMIAIYHLIYIILIYCIES